jgi:hypothetical protein
VLFVKNNYNDQVKEDGWAGHAVRIWENRIAYGIWWKNQKEGAYYEYQGTSGWIVIEIG